MPDQTPTTFSANPKDSAFFNNPYPVYDEMRKLGPAFIWEEYDMVCFPHHLEVNTLLRDRRCGRDFSAVMTRAEMGLEPIPERLAPFYDMEANSMLELEPPAHTRLRKLVNRAFVSRQIEALNSSVSELAEALIDSFPKDKPFDLLPTYAEKIPVIVIARLLGVPEDMSDQLLDWSHKMVAMYQFNRSRETEDAAVKASQAFSDYISQYIEKRRSEPGDDLISALISAEEEGSKLSHDELVTTCILLLNAGHEATVHAIGNSVSLLLQQGSEKISEFMAADEKYAGVDELLRFDPPLHQFTRYVLEDFEISGVQLKKGQTIGLMLGAANRDPKKYANPDTLDFTRGGLGHVSFGAGIHFCVGAPLARLEMQIALSKLFEKAPTLKLAQKPTFADRYHFHGLEKLMVEIGEF